jgi:O-antigen/teichoic acid export membrane protein
VSGRAGVILTSAANIAVPLAAFMSAPLLARALTVEERGQVAAVTAAVQLTVALFAVGLPDAATYFAARSARGPSRRGFHLAIAFGAVGSVALFLAAPLVAPDDIAIQGYVRAAAFAVLPTLVLMVVRGTALGDQRWAVHLADNLLGPFCRLVTLAVLLGFGVLTPLTATLVLVTTGFIGLLVYAPRRPQTRPPLQHVPATQRESVLKFGVGVWIGSLSGVFLSTLDQVLMTSLSTAYQLGLYAVAVSVSQVVLVFNTSLRSVVLSVESRQGDDDRLAATARISTLLTVALSLLVALAAPFVVPALFGREYQGAVILVEILLLSTILGNPGSVAGMGLMARGKPAARSWSLLAAAVVNVTLVLIFVPAGGAVAAAWATVAAGAIAGNLNILFLRLGYQVPMRQFYGIRTADLVELRRHAREMSKSVISIVRRGTKN